MPRFRARRVLAAALAAAVVATAAGCTTTGADEPTKGAGGQGYPGVARNLTRIDPAQRKTIGAVSGPELGGRGTLSVADHIGKVVVINVWGSWCTECRLEAADLEAASRATTKDVQFIGITSKDLDQAPALAYQRAFKITYPSIFDPDGKTLLAFAGQLPPSAVPSTLILDKQGRLAVRILGPITKITLVDIITDIAAGK